MRTYATIAEIKAVQQRAGLHFFDDDTMEHWRSVVYEPVIGGRLFITGERYDEDDPERYSVREVRSDGRISIIVPDDAESTDRYGYWSDRTAAIAWARSLDPTRPSHYLLAVVRRRGEPIDTRPIAEWRTIAGGGCDADWREVVDFLARTDAPD